MSTSALSAETDWESLAKGCDKAYRAADTALNAKIQEASLCNLGVQLRSDEITRLQTQNAKLLDRNTSVWSNPFVYAAIGVIFGAWAGARAVR